MRQTFEMKPYGKEPAAQELSEMVLNGEEPAAQDLSEMKRQGEEPAAGARSARMRLRRSRWPRSGRWQKISLGAEEAFRYASCGLKLMIGRKGT